MATSARSMASPPAGQPEGRDRFEGAEPPRLDANARHGDITGAGAKIERDEIDRFARGRRQLRREHLRGIAGRGDGFRQGQRRILKGRSARKEAVEPAREQSERGGIARLHLAADAARAGDDDTGSDGRRIGRVACRIRLAETQSRRDR